MATGSETVTISLTLMSTQSYKCSLTSNCSDKIDVYAKNMCPSDCSDLCVAKSWYTDVVSEILEQKKRNL